MKKKNRCPHCKKELPKENEVAYGKKQAYSCPYCKKEFSDAEYS